MFKGPSGKSPSWVGAQVSLLTIIKVIDHLYVRQTLLTKETPWFVQAHRGLPIQYLVGIQFILFFIFFNSKLKKWLKNRFLKNLVPISQEGIDGSWGCMIILNHTRFPSAFFCNFLYFKILIGILRVFGHSGLNGDAYFAPRWAIFFFKTIYLKIWTRGHKFGALIPCWSW